MLFNEEFVFLHYPRSAGKSLTRYLIEAWRGPIHGPTRNVRQRSSRMSRHATKRDSTACGCCVPTPS